MKTKKFSKYLILTLCLILITTFLFPTSALARGITVEETVEKGEVLDENLVMFGSEVVMDGVINGDVIAVGDKITINGEIDGSLIVAGKNVVLNGPVTGSVYSSALTLGLDPLANIGRDVGFIGGSLKTQEGSTINRDLNVISLESDLAGDVNRQVNALVGPLNLIEGIYDYMRSQGWLPQIQFLESLFSQEIVTNKAALGMTFGLPFWQSLKLVPSAAANEPTVYAGQDLQSPQPASTIDVERVKDWAIPLIRNLVALLILGLLAIWLVPAQLSWAGEQARKSPWRALLTGLLVLILGWLSAFLLFLLILALAFFFYWISLPTLGFLVGTLGLTSLGLAVTLFWLSIVYFSKIVIANLFGTLLFKRFLPKYAQNRFWPLLVGVFLYALLASIPYLGWIVALLSTLAGLGVLWKISSSRRLPQDLMAEPLQASEEIPKTVAPSNDMLETGSPSEDMPETGSPSQG